MNDNYESFLASKHRRAETYGRKVDDAEISSVLFPFQRAIVRWAVERGRAAIFADCGMGKTLMQLEWARLIGERTIIMTPLAVAHQTVAEAGKLGMAAKYCRSMQDAEGVQIVVANYEMLDSFDSAAFGAVVLDESSILKSFMGKTKRRLFEVFGNTRYRLACTATPAPNDHMELGNHADFLGIMPSNEMLSRWFINDTMKAGAYRLKGHARDDFWKWVTSWAVCASRPSDVGDFSDDGFVLPPLEVHVHQVEDQGRAFARGTFFADANLSATDIWRDKRETSELRCAAAAKIVTSDRPWIVWCDTNDESERITKLIPGSVEVKGSMSVAEKERRLDAFADGEAKVIVTKSEIAGFGLNWQHCADMVFVGMTYSFEKVYQAVRRCYRFGQKAKVNVHFVVIDSEGNVLEAFESKRKEHAVMQEEMIAATREHGLDESRNRGLTTVAGDVAHGEDWSLYLGDCVSTVKGKIAPNSVGLSVFSPPFSNLYIYSDADADMGNSADHAEFFRHFGFLIPELLRVTMPGRLCAVHCKDLPLYMGRDGAAGLYDFPADISKAFVAAGWTFHSRVTIWKDPVTEMQRTKNHGLLHKNFVQRREVCRQGMADYVLVFRKWTEEIPDGQIARAPKPREFIGEQPPTDWNDDRDYSIQVWQRYASPVWFDIRQQEVLEYIDARSEKDERHICPLQLDVIRRCVELWSNPGDLVLSPFTGIGSEGYVALEQGRKFVGVELKREYFETAVRNLNRAVASRDQLDLFATGIK